MYRKFFALFFSVGHRKEVQLWHVCGEKKIYFIVVFGAHIAINTKLCCVSKSWLTYYCILIIKIYYCIIFVCCESLALRIILLSLLTDCFRQSQCEYTTKEPKNVHEFNLMPRRWKKLPTVNLSTYFSIAIFQPNVAKKILINN